MSLFCTLYDLAIEILTAQKESELGKLTSHHYPLKEAENVLQDAILQRTMPNESPQTEWGIIRIFMQNLVNRAYAPMPIEEMKSTLDNITQSTQDSQTRIYQLFNKINKNVRLNQSLTAILDPTRAPNQQSYISWLQDRISYYSNKEVNELSPSEILNDLSKISIHHDTKIRNMGTPLAANLFADMGIRAFAKPDLHIKDIISHLVNTKKISQTACIKKIIEITKQEAKIVNNSNKFTWLDGGLYPRH